MLDTAHRGVLSVGMLPRLLSLREQIMRSQGFLVFSTADFDAADIEIDRNGWDVLLLCYSIDDDWRERLITHFRAHCPEGRIVAITNHPVTETPKEVDALVYGIEGPEALMSAIQNKAA